LTLASAVAQTDAPQFKARKCFYLNEYSPLVIVLHGYGGKAEGYLPEMIQVADRYGFALCYDASSMKQAQNMDGKREMMMLRSWWAV